jgi:hypothetical protein
MRLEWRRKQSLRLNWRGPDNRVLAIPYDEAMKVLAELPSGSRNSDPIIYIQSLPASIWTIAHNLNHYPDVTLYDDTDDQIFGNIHHDDANQVSIIFSTPIAGRARID